MSKAGPAFAAALLLLAPATGFAQEAGKMGISIGFPSSVGFIWHLSDKIAVRPDFAFVHSSTEGSSTETSSLGTTLGVSVLFYVKKWDSVAAYVAPGFAWSRTHGEFASTLFPGQNESTNHNYQYSGSLGAQGWIGQRFGVFGELGLQYTRNSFEPSDFDLPQRSRSIGLGSGVGVVLYF